MRPAKSVVRRAGGGALMPADPRPHVPLTPAQIAEVDRIAATHRWSRSRALAVLVEEAIEARTRPPVYVDPLADANGNRHHMDGSRCTDAYCRRAHAIPLAAKVPHAE